MLTDKALCIDLAVVVSQLLLTYLYKDYLFMITDNVLCIDLTS